MYLIDEKVEMDEKCDIEKIVEENKTKDFDRMVYGRKANNESLPFNDEVFDSYIANLSL